MFEECWQVYRVRKTWLQLRREGFDFARRTVAWVMKDTDIQGVIRGKLRKTTIPDKTLPCPLDKVNRPFRAPAPNMKWVSDFNHVATWTGFVYVAFGIAAYARMIVGWCVSTSPHAGLVLDALEQAVHERRPTRGMGLVHHSDRGSPYLSVKYTERFPKRAASLRSAAWETATTTRWPRRSAACSRPKSSPVAAPGPTSKPSKTQASTGSTGSTTAACMNR
jgi:transposase InsO family protein